MYISVKSPGIFKLKFRRHGGETWMSKHHSGACPVREDCIKIHQPVHPSPSKLWLRNENLIQDKKREALDVLPSTGDCCRATFSSPGTQHFLA